MSNAQLKALTHEDLLVTAISFRNENEEMLGRLERYEIVEKAAKELNERLREENARLKQMIEQAPELHAYENQIVGMFWCMKLMPFVAGEPKYTARIVNIKPIEEK